MRVRNIATRGRSAATCGMTEQEPLPCRVCALSASASGAAPPTPPSARHAHTTCILRPSLWIITIVLFCTSSRCVAAALARTVQELRDSAHLANATLVSREITAEGVSLEGCDSYLVVADANQSRLLVSNSAHDTALPHSCLEAILASRHRLVLAVVGGRTRGFRNPEPGSVWSESVERVLRQTDQALALEVASAAFLPPCAPASRACRPRRPTAVPCCSGAAASLAQSRTVGMRRLVSHGRVFSFMRWACAGS